MTDNFEETGIKVCASGDRIILWDFEWSPQFDYAHRSLNFLGSCPICQHEIGDHLSSNAGTSYAYGCIAGGYPVGADDRCSCGFFLEELDFEDV